MRARSENLILCLATTAAVLAAGCTTAPAGNRSRAAIPANQGQAWEVVLPSEATALAAAEGTEYSRRDLIFASPEESDLPFDAWPQPFQPGLERTRRLFLNLRSDEVLFIQQWPVSFVRPWGWSRPWLWR